MMIAAEIYFDLTVIEKAAVSEQLWGDRGMCRIGVKCPEQLDHRFSNTPQGSIDNIDSHLTEASRDNAGANGKSEGSSETESTDNYTLIRRGNIGVQPLGNEINKLRNAFINVDMEIILELKDLFLMIY